MFDLLLMTDLRFPLDGSVRLHFSSGPESRLLLGVNESHGRYSVEPSTGIDLPHLLFTLGPLTPDHGQLLVAALTRQEIPA